MAPIVLIFGLISGAICALMMLITLPFMDRIGFEWSEIIGYTTLVASALLIFFGVRSYREKAGGTVTFGRAFTVGLLIALVSSLIYVVTWQFVYSNLTPDFVDKMQAHMIEKARADGQTEAEIEATRQWMASYKELIKNPFMNMAVTLIEPLPIGLAAALISAAVLRRKPR
jgi:hypothetical protein